MMVHSKTKGIATIGADQLQRNLPLGLISITTCIERSHFVLAMMQTKKNAARYERLSTSRPPSPLAQVSIQPCRILRGQIGRGRCSAIVYLQIVACVAIDLVQHLSEGQGDIRVGVA